MTRRVPEVAQQGQLAAFAAGALIAAAPAQPASRGPAGAWMGQCTAVHTAEMGLVTLERRMTCDFSLAVAADGTVRGSAIVRYEARLNDERLRGVLAQAQQIGALPVRLVPIVGTTLGAGVSWTDVTGMATTLDESVATRTGQVEGALRGGRLTLRWVSAPEAMPYTTYAISNARRRTVRSGSMPAFGPWVDAAFVTRLGDAGWEARSTTRRATANAGARRTLTADWSAMRVGS